MKVLYIGGTGRTGSTLLDRLLGSAEGWFSGGELAFIWRYGLAKGGLCSCGVPLADCPIWSQVLELAGRDVPIDPERMVALRHRFWSVHLPLTVSRRYREHKLDRLEEFPAVVERLYRAAGEVTGARVLVDSSKDSHYSMILRERTALDVYFLHLVRDPRAIGYSWTKQRGERGFGDRVDMERRGILKASMYFWVSNVASEVQWRGRPDRARLLRYEDLVADPHGVAARIAEFVGEDLDLDDVLVDGAFEPGEMHTTWGNPNRFERGRTRISSDDAWRTAQPAWRSAVLGALEVPLARRYGYPWRTNGSLSEPSTALTTLGSSADLVEEDR